MNKCRNCGADIENGALFCENCGKTIERAQEERRKMPWYIMIVVGIPSMAVLIYAIVAIIKAIFQ